MQYFGHVTEIDHTLTDVKARSQQAQAFITITAMNTDNVVHFHTDILSVAWLKVLYLL